MTVSVLLFFLIMLCVGLQCVIVVFPDYTHAAWSVLNAQSSQQTSLTGSLKQGNILDMTNASLLSSQKWFWGAQWLSGRVFDSRQRGCGFEPHGRHCLVTFSKTH